MNFRNFLLVLFRASGVVIATVTLVAARPDGLSKFFSVKLKRVE